MPTKYRRLAKMKRGLILELSFRLVSTLALDVTNPIPSGLYCGVHDKRFPALASKHILAARFHFPALGLNLQGTFFSNAVAMQ